MLQSTMILPIGRPIDGWSNGSSNIFTDRQTVRPLYTDAFLQNAKKIVKHIVNCSLQFKEKVNDRIMMMINDYVHDDD